MTNKQPATISDPVTGRTPWDVAAEVLMTLQRIGPSAIVVAGFLLFGYFFYIEVTKAKLNADQQLQIKLDAAQTQLVSTYEKMGGMSDQLIQNIENLLELNIAIDANVKRSRQQLKELELVELKALKTEKLRLAVENQRAQDKIDVTYIRAKIATYEADYAIGHISTTRGRVLVSKREQDSIAELVRRLPSDDASLVQGLQSNIEEAVLIADITAKELKNLDKSLTSIGVTKSLLELRIDPGGVTAASGQRYELEKIKIAPDDVILEWLRAKEEQ